MQRHRQGGVGSSENLRNSGRAEVSAARHRGRRGGGNRSRPGLVLISGAVFLYVLRLLLLWFSASPSKSGELWRTAVTTANVDGFQGTSRTANIADDKLRIAIVSNAVAFPYSSATTALWSLFKEYFANKDCYAKTHGYDLIIDSRYNPLGRGSPSCTARVRKHDPVRPRQAAPVDLVTYDSADIGVEGWCEGGAFGSSPDVFSHP